MAEEDAFEFWRAIMGDSEDEESDFEGFALHEVDGGDESDVDLDLVVNNDRILANFNEEIEDSGENVSDFEEGDSDTELPVAAGPSQRKKGKKSSKKEKNEVHTNWASPTQTVKPLTFAGYDKEQSYKVGVSHDLPVGAEPFEYFCLLVPDVFWNTIAAETNRYAEQKQENKTDKDWHVTTPNEMKLFIFINFMFGIHRLPEVQMYWSTDPLLRVPAVADVMSRNRFNKLNQYFHLNNNHDAVQKGNPGYDPLFKVRPLLDLVHGNSTKHYHPGQDISIDEAMIKFNGRLSFKQYIKG